MDQQRIGMKFRSLCLGALFLMLQSSFSLTFAGSDINPAGVTYLTSPTDYEAHPALIRFVPIQHRAKRQAANISLDEIPDKGELLKGASPTKKPIYKAKENGTLSASKELTDKKTINANESTGITAAAETTVAPMKVFPLPKNDSLSNVTIAPWWNKTIDIDDDELLNRRPIEFPLIDADLPNVTKNNHTYYTSTYYRNGQFLWIELEQHANAQVHDLLSDAHRRAATVKLLFEFPFYGHMISNVTMATGGFLYLGPHVHAWLAATQYVAPLMANFDSRLVNSTIRYLSNDTQFTVQWHDVFLHDSPEAGKFKFQTTLHKNGTITFAYKDIPLNISLVNDTNHPVKVGLSDAYISERHILFVKQKTIYEYDRIDLTNQSIVSGSAFVFTALPTCQMHKTCEECTTHKTEFDCSWCPNAERCSDGTDRDRQDWLLKKCGTQNVRSPVECHISTNTPDSNTTHYQSFDDHERRDVLPDHKAEESMNTNNNGPQLISAVQKDSGGIGASGVVAILFFLGIVLCIGGWVIYAYYYPHTPSGQLLIRFRPSQWGAFRRGEARYTAASSIHM